MSDRRIRRAVDYAVRVVDRWIEYRRAFARVPAVSVGIVHDGTIVFTKGYGYAVLATRTRATGTTCYRIASISKTITATAVMQLVERGVMQLDDKVQKFLPWFRSKNDPGLAEITVRHLLTHMAGIERDGDTAHWENDRFPTLERIQEHVREGVAVYRPLETFKYSNLGYAIVGQVIETVSGRSYERVVESEITRKLRLTHTSPTLNGVLRKRLARGYGRDIPPHRRVAVAHAETNAMVPATGFVSNARDLCVFMSALFLGNPIILSDESKREMHRVHWLNKKTDHHYGIGHHIWKDGPNPIVGHGGGFPGFITRIGWDPERKVGVAVLTNALDDLAGTLLTGIFSTISYFADHDAKFRASRKRSTSLARYEGRFSSRWSDADVVSVGGQLVAFVSKSDKPMADAVILERLGGHVFRISSGDEFGYLGERATFRFNRRGRLTGLSWGPIPMRVSR